MGLREVVHGIAFEVMKQFYSLLEVVVYESIMPWNHTVCSSSHSANPFPGFHNVMQLRKLPPLGEAG